MRNHRSTARTSSPARIPAIAGGLVPVTQEMVNSLVDIRLFMIRAAFPSSALNEAGLREKLTSAGLDNLARCSPEETQMLLTAPVGWAEMRVEWEKLNPWQKEATARQWAQMAGPLMDSLAQRDNEAGNAPEQQSTDDRSCAEIARDIARGSQIQTIMNLNWRYRL